MIHFQVCTVGDKQNALADLHEQQRSSWISDIVQISRASRDIVSPF